MRSLSKLIELAVRYRLYTEYLILKSVQIKGDVMIDVKYYLQWCEWVKEYLRDKSRGSLPLQTAKAEPIHLLMNGCSLPNTIDYLDKKPGKVMMVNMALCEPLKLRPDYYCFVDPRYGQKEDWAVRDLFVELEKYPEPLVVFTISSVKNKLSIQNRNITVQQVCNNDCPEYRGKRERNLLQKNIAAFTFQGVIIAALYISIQLGYKTIYLHGADGDYGKTRINEKNELYFRPIHYYDVESGGWEEKKTYNMLDDYRSLVRLYEGLYGIEKYARDCGVRIINMYNESLVDCFEKIGSNIDFRRE